MTTGFDGGSSPGEASGQSTGPGGIQWAEDVAEADSGEAAVGANGADGGAASPAGAEPGSGPAPDAPAPPDTSSPETESGGSESPAEGGAFSVEDLVKDLERVTVERDQYLDTSRRLQSEFDNYRKQVARREAEQRERAAESLVSELLPVLDACDGAVANGVEDVEPVRTTLIEALTKQGLERIEGSEEPFDPAKHDAVLHEPADEADGPVVAEVMRAGYSWNGRVVRPAMVKVRG